MVNRKFYVRILKPIWDWFFAFMMLFVLSPLLISLVFILSVAFQGKPFFTQVRVGKNQRLFKILKFRSMKEKTIELKSDQDRLTRIGKFIRKTSLDELPQLVNVLAGDMSIVGPRPLYPEYLRYYSEKENMRHGVKPGITGLAQVYGRNAINWGERLKLDVDYVKNVSFLMDLKIILKTFLVVIRTAETEYKDDEVVTFTEYASKR